MIGLSFEEIRKGLNPSEPEMQAFRKKLSESERKDLPEMTATIQLIFDRIAEIIHLNNQKIEADIRDAGIQKKS